MARVVERKINGFDVAYEVENETELTADLISIKVKGLSSINPLKVLGYLNSASNPLGKDWMLLEQCHIYDRYVSGKFDIEQEEVPFLDAEGNELEESYEIVDGVVKRKKEYRIISDSFFDIYVHEGNLELDIKRR